MDGSYKNERNELIMSSKSKKIIGVSAVVALVALLATVFFVFREAPVQGSKAVVIQVINKAEETKVYSLKTDAEYLKQAMEEAEGLEFKGSDGQYGLMITEVNGELADFNTNGAYWSFYVNDDYCNYGIDQQPVNDGDTFKIVYTLG